jgi:hypothetical protein
MLIEKIEEYSDLRRFLNFPIPKFPNSYLSPKTRLGIVVGFLHTEIVVYEKDDVYRCDHDIGLGQRSSSPRATHS